VLDILFLEIREDKNIVYIDDAENIKEFPQNVINKGLKDSRYISQPKGYNCIFKKAVLGSKGYKGLVALLNLNLIKPPTKVKSRKDFSSREPLKRVVYKGQRYFVTLSNSV
jgi:hypothetical protein